MRTNIDRAQRLSRGGAHHLLVWASLALALALIACAQGEPAENEPCARAVARLEQECGFTVGGTDGGADYNCTGSAECAADCLYTTPCEDIKANTSVFSGCLDACK